MKPFSIFTNAVRAKEILGILVRHGFGGLIQNIDAPPGWTARFFPEPTARRTLWQRIRDVCEEMGPTCVKFAQVLSTRPDLIPAPLVEELKQLRTHVKPVSYEEIRPLIEDALGGEIDRFFVDLHPEPVASGSLAQVYKATLRANGRLVAVKVQRPSIERAINSDLNILAWLAERLNESIIELQPYDLPSLVEQTRKGIEQELDFTREARNAQHFNLTNPNPDQIFAPIPFMEYTSRGMIVYEWVEGVHTHKVRLSPEEGTRLASLGGHSIFHQIIINGFFHGDPHSGNILVTEDKRICLVDWGLAGQLTRRMRYFLADIFAGAAAQDPEKIVRTICMMSEGTHRIDRTRLEKEIATVLRNYPDFSTRSEAVGRLILDLIYTLGSNGIHLSRDYALLGKAILSMEEAATTLDPNFDIRSIAKPYLEKLNWERHNPYNVAQNLYWAAIASLQQLQALPTDLNRILHRLEGGDLRVQMELTGLNRMRSVINRAAMRLVIGLIIGSLIVGSSLIVASGKGPHLWGLPTLGIIGYSLSIGLTVLLLWDAWRKQ